MQVACAYLDYIHKTLVQIANLKFVTHNKFKNTYDQFR